VSVGQIDGHATGLPATWTRSEESVFCLGCSRALAAESAVESATPGHSPDEVARLRRRAMIEFEIGRRPDATDRMVAQACRTSSSAVGRVREGLG
jgi:hypothetical protein